MKHSADCGICYVEHDVPLSLNFHHLISVSPQEDDEGSSQQQGQRSVQRQALSRLLAGAACLLAGLLAFPFHGKLTYMLLVGLVGIVGGIVLAVVCMGKYRAGRPI